MDEKVPLITVNVSLYNQLENLKVILEALKLQTVQNFEISITDDGSSDGAREYCATLPYRYYWQEDKGFRLAKSRNMGIKDAKGKYFLSIEGDTIPHPSLIESYMPLLEENTVLLGVRHEIDKRPELPLDFSKIVPFETDHRLPYFMRFDPANKPYLSASGCNLLLPLKALRNVGGWDEGYTTYGRDDYDVVMRMWVKGVKVTPSIRSVCYHIDHKHYPSPVSDMRFRAKERELGL